MQEWNPEHAARVLPLLRDCDMELSVAAVLGGTLPGQILVDDRDAPRTAMIRTSETTLLTGDPENPRFLEELRETLGWWETVFPDSPGWDLTACHPNPWMKPYLRRQYTAQRLLYTPPPLPEGMELIRITPETPLDALENGDTVTEWASHWGMEHFFTDGAGFAVRQENTLCAWSLTDCRIADKAAIGIVTDPRYRRRGLAAAVSAACAGYWFDHGISRLDWLCVAKNKGSQATARKLGFTLCREYTAYTPFPPYENDADCGAEEWAQWYAYYEEAARRYPDRYQRIRERCRRLMRDASASD